MPSQPVWLFRSLEKRTKGKIQVGLKTLKICNFLFTYRLYLVLSVFIYMKEVTFFLLSFSPTMGRRRLACDVFDLFAIHCSLVHDITTGHKMAALMCMSLCFPIKSHLQISGCFTVKCKNVKRQV